MKLFDKITKNQLRDYKTSTRSPDLNILADTHDILLLL